ncbi:MAG: 5,10-methylenetetrahydrofolate reductase [Desulfobacteraceae bacterium]|nr:5,10-methylenetetrahydrofolate reductase [Desulfobacteraceae bacterium]
MGFQKKLTKGEFAVLAEINTPKGVDISELTMNTRFLKSRIDAVILPDMDNGIMHMSSLGSGAIMLQQGLEPLIHVCGRDRNRMALQGDLLSAHILGIQNLLFVQAEEMANSDHQDATPVNDLDEKGLIHMVKSLNSGKDLSGFELSGTPDFFMGFAMPSILDDTQLEKEMEKAKEKIDLGARFVLTQPVFDLDFYSTVLNKLTPLNIPVISSVFLLKSVGMARYMSINDPNCRLSEDIITRLRKSKDREAEAIEIAGEMIRQLKEICQGIKISALGWEDRLPTILDSAGL